MNLRNFCITYIQIVVGTISSLFCFITAFHIPMPLIVPLFFSMVITGILLVVYEKKGTIVGDRILLITLLLLGIYTLFFRTGILDAIDSILYYIRKELMDTNVIQKMYLYIPKERFYAITPFFILCSMLITCLVVLFIGRFHLPILALLLTFPIVEAGLYFGAVPNYSYFFSYVIFFLVSLATIRFRKKAIPKGFFSVFTTLLIICFLLSNVLLDKISYERPRKWDSIRNAVILKDYDTLSTLIGFQFQLPFFNSSAQINAGDLRNLGNKSISNKTALTVSMPSSLSTVYLKGYVGTTYKKNQWNVQSEQEFQQGLSDFYTKNTLSKTTLSPLDYLSISQNNNSLYQEEMTITPELANKNYAYVPYTMLPNEEVSPIQDLYYIPKNKKSYTIPYGVTVGTNPIQNSMFKENSVNSSNTATPSLHPLIPISIYSDYLELGTSYHKYSNIAYTELEEDVKKQLNETTKIIQEIALTRNISYIQAMNWYFTESGTFTYTLKPGTVSSETDSTLYFLNETHKGYCVHFASAATLLLRNLGVPARYVEGYIIPPFTTAKGSYDSTKNEYTVSVPVSNAHAWTEYYVEGSGWHILDVTPSSYYDILESESTENSQLEEQATTTSQPNTTIASTETTKETTTEKETLESDNPSDSNDTVSHSESNAWSISNWLKRLPFGVKVVFTSFLAMIVAFLLLTIRRWILLLLRNKHFHQTNPNQSAIAMLEWLFYLLTIVPPSNAEQQIIEDRMKPLFDLAKYSQHTITKEELLEIKTLIRTTEAKTKKHLTLLKRLFHQFLSKKPLR